MDSKKLQLKSRAMSMLVLVSLMSFGLTATFATEEETPALPPLAGAVTLEGPYQISDCSSLQRINETQRSNFILVNDIDCTNSAELNDGQGFIPISGFEGYLDGRNYTISNLVISSSTTGQLGLFSSIDGFVRNLRFENIAVSNSFGNAGASHSGIVAGINRGNVDNVSVATSTVSSRGEVGGIVGKNEGTIARSAASVSFVDLGFNYSRFGGITGANTGEISDSLSNMTANFENANNIVCGGLVGHSDGGSIDRSYAAHFFKCPGSNTTVGGLVGEVINGSSVTNSFAATTPQHGDLFDGAIVGYNPKNIDLSTNYFDQSRLGITSCDSEGSTTCVAVNIDNSNPSYFFGNNENTPMSTWNFDSTWQVIENAYPALQIDRVLPHLTPLVQSAGNATDTMELSWNPPVGSNENLVTGYEIIYKQNVTGVATINPFGDPSWQVWTTVSGDTLSTTLEGLDLNTSYSFRVRALNEAGPGMPSYPLSVMAVPPAINEVQSTNTTSRSVTINWDDQSAIASSYSIQYKKSGTEQWSSTTPNNFPANSKEILPLDENTSYDFRVAGVNSRGTGSYSTITTALTLDQQSYLISSCEQLQAINDDVYGYYELTQDIDCSATADWDEDRGFEPIANPFVGPSFSGTLEGNGHSIEGLTIRRSNGLNGLFASINGATVQNLNFDGGSIANEINNDNVYNDVQINPGTGALAAVAASSTIDNVTSSLEIRGNSIEGYSGATGGLIGMVIPSAFGPGADVTSTSITNVEVTGNITGLVSGGIVGGSTVVDIFGITMTEAQSPDEAVPYIGSKLDVTISDSQVASEIRCVVVCAGVAGLNISNLTISNVVNSGSTGVINVTLPDFPDNFDELLTKLYMLGPVSAGLVGGSAPLSTNGIPSQLIITDSLVDGALEGTITAGVVGVTLPSVTLDAQNAIQNGFERAIADIVTDFFGGAVQTKSLVVSNTTVDSDIACVFICAGVTAVSLGDTLIDNVDVNGEIGSINVENEISQVPVDEDELLALLFMSGPFSGGFGGISLPLSLTSENASFDITNSTLNGNVTGTVSSGGVALNLPSIRVPATAIASFVDIIAGGQEPQMQEIMDLVFAAFQGLLSNDALNLDNVQLNSDINCGIICGGATALSIGQTSVNNTTLSGDLTNDNSSLINAGHPIAMCPAQITGGLVGAQVLFGADITDSSVTGNTTVVQAGNAGNTTLIDLASLIAGGVVENPQMFIIESICSVASTLQGTGGVIGTFVSPFEISEIANTLFQTPGATTPFALNINNTSNAGVVSSDASSATGGIAGYIFGQADLSGATSSGDVSNSTFAELFRTPIASASTGGLVGRTQGGFKFSGDLLAMVFEIIELNNDPEFDPTLLIGAYENLNIEPSYVNIFGSSSTGNVYSSNSAGGLIGNAATHTRVEKSFATGDVYGVSAGGLIGSGFNMGSLLGALNIFGSIELNNTYARGDVYAVDEQDTVTFAGGLVGSMIHTGAFSIDNSYSTGAVGVENGSTDTRLVAGGLVGGVLDLGVLPALAQLGTQLDPDSNFIFNTMVKGSMQAFGLEFREGVSISNSFTTSTVPANSEGPDTLLTDIGSGNPPAYTTSGTLIGFLFSVDTNTIPTTLPQPEQSEEPLGVQDEGEGSGQDPDQNTGLTPEMVFGALDGIRWNTTEDVVSNTYFDYSKVNTNQCGTTLPTFADITSGIFSEIESGPMPQSPLEFLNFLPQSTTATSSSCIGVNVGGTQPAFFKNNDSVAPLNSWDFNSTWHVQDSDFPTFVAPTVDSPDGNGGTGGTGSTATNTPNPNNGGNTPFIPTTVTPDDIADVAEQIIGLVPELPPIAEVLPDLAENIQDELNGQAATLIPDTDDGGLINAVIGIMSATGMFLLRNLATVLLLLILGGALWFHGRKKKSLIGVSGGGDNQQISKGF